MASQPTARTLAALRKEGWTCAVVEKWIPQMKRRVDLFGCIDIVAIREGETLGVQCTTRDNQSSRITKIHEEPRMRLWVAAGNRLAVYGWAKRGPKGKRKLWQATVTELTISDLQPKD
jgi:hypothetical protein